MLLLVGELNFGSTFWQGHFVYLMRNIQPNPYLSFDWKFYGLDGHYLTSKWNGSFQCNSEFDNISRLCNIRCLIFLISAQVSWILVQPFDGAILGTRWEIFSPIPIFDLIGNSTGWTVKTWQVNETKVFKKFRIWQHQPIV